MLWYFFQGTLRKLLLRIKKEFGTAKPVERNKLKWWRTGSQIKVIDYYIYQISTVNEDLKLRKLFYLTAGPTKKFENSKVKFLSSEEVISMSRGTVRQCIKTTTTSIASSIQTAQSSGTPTKTQTSMDKSSSGTNCLVSFVTEHQAKKRL